MTTQLSEQQRATLQALCDTIVPAVAQEPDPDGFWARRASDLGIHHAVEGIVLGLPDETSRAGLIELLDVMALQRLAQAPSQASREQILRNLTLASPAAAQGVGALTAMTLFLYYGAPIDPQTGQNPNWATFGYPGPVSPPPQEPKAIQPLVPADGQVLEADVVVVGSGAGGGVIAGTLAQAGLKVVVLEAAGYFNESDFLQLEIPAYQQMYWRGGPTPTADLNVSLQAGTTLGGGTTINWTNCLRTYEWVREQSGARARAGGRRRPGVRPPPRPRARAHRRHARLQRPQRPAAAPQGGLRGARLEHARGHPQRRPGEVPARDRGLPRLRRPVGREALDGEDVPARRGRARRRDPRAHARAEGAR
jgi:hypothetical protein